jgi:hypothetical protein
MAAKLIGTAGTREGVELQIVLNSSAITHVTDGRRRLVQGWSLNRDQARELGHLLVRSSMTVEPPPDPSGMELVQTGDFAESPAPTGPVEPVHR